VTALFEPPASEAAARFWNATRQRRLVLPWCTVCELPIWYPREVCPRCLDDAIEWRSASGVGAVHAVSVQHRPGPGREPAAGPYTVALVDLAEGVRIMSNVVGCPPETVRVGMDVRVAWHPLSDGRHLPQFEPASVRTSSP
jgi:uncharacterized OB-fold protein